MLPECECDKLREELGALRAKLKECEETTRHFKMERDLFRDMHDERGPEVQSLLDQVNTLTAQLDAANERVRQLNEIAEAADNLIRCIGGSYHLALRYAQKKLVEKLKIHWSAPPMAQPTEEVNALSAKLEACERGVRRLKGELESSINAEESEREIAIRHAKQTDAANERVRALEGLVCDIADQHCRDCGWIGHHFDLGGDSDQHPVCASSNVWEGPEDIRAALRAKLEECERERGEARQYARDHERAFTDWGHMKAQLDAANERVRALEEALKFYGAVDGVCINAGGKRAKSALPQPTPNEDFPWVDIVDPPKAWTPQEPEKPTGGEE